MPQLQRMHALLRKILPDSIKIPPAIIQPGPEAAKQTKKPLSGTQQSKTDQYFFFFLLYSSTLRHKAFLNCFIYLFLSALGRHSRTWAFSSCSKWGATLQWWGVGFPLQPLETAVRESQVDSLVVEHRLQGVRAQQLWSTGFVAPRHVESSRIKDWMCVPCVSRQILIHCTTEEVLRHNSNSHFKVSDIGIHLNQWAFLTDSWDGISCP